ncbi:hypothetical protein H310_00733 [Aphanomyces invadans]|uniref:VOC domain-containing protein n=1 Tax=Aphanomyces invadans TaxID=157072 RepID=A0A024UVA5_9STRA|nr:hypothetical protein H310_00733 [Aphanomyces invadans]ETW10426.1 hypothetical protein H310_00733 [Aphanomyces invadans]RHY32691.1 hypothetical protein DYB32_002336 [Aphanomyces invadans]|eukprot:XP_008861837.1 hypothetical protein H310_00733 [Aphanomyces invadans]
MRPTDRSRPTADGNVLLLEHINLSIQESGDDATSSGIFYLNVLGCARDPRVQRMVHANIGLSQFHVLPDQPVGQRINGEIALFYPDLDQFAEHVAKQAYPHEWKNCRSNHLPPSIASWDFANASSLYRHIQLLCPNRNVFKCFQAPEDYSSAVEAIGTQPGAHSLGMGMAYIKFFVRSGIALGIARFYEEFLGATCTMEKSSDGQVVCAVECGSIQRLLFEEVSSDVQLQPYDGHHICIYISEFESSFFHLHERQLTWNNPLFEDRCDSWAEAEKHNQYRILRVVDPATETLLMELEHEIRPVSHSRCPLYANPNSVSTISSGM